MATRRRAREVALQLLYEADLNPNRSPEEWMEFILRRLRGRKALASFSFQLLEGTLLHRKQIDRQLASYATNWSLNRMAVTDRNILRLAAYEIVVAKTPGRVAINEAVDLARRYGDRNSPRFVNGVLDKLLHSQNSGSSRQTMASPKSDSAPASAGE